MDHRGHEDDRPRRDDQHRRRDEERGAAATAGKGRKGGKRKSRWNNAARRRWRAAGGAREGEDMRDDEGVEGRGAMDEGNAPVAPRGEDAGGNADTREEGEVEDGDDRRRKCVKRCSRADCARERVAREQRLWLLHGDLPCWARIPIHTK